MRTIWHFTLFCAAMLLLGGFLIGVWFGKQQPCSDIESVDIHKIPHAEDGL